MSSRHRDSDCKVYVGDLATSATKQDLEEAFRQYGPLKNVWVARHPPGFAFIEFDDPRDAEDAVKGLDGRTIVGRRVRVEPSNPSNRRRGSGGRGPPPRRGRAYHPEDKCYQCGERGHYARDCSRYDRRGRSRRTRSSSRSRSRSRDRRSRSRDRKNRSRSASRSRSRSNVKSGSRERKRSESSRSRSATPVKKSKTNGSAD